MLKAHVMTLKKHFFLDKFHLPPQEIDNAIFRVQEKHVVVCGRHFTI